MSVASDVIIGNDLSISHDLTVNGQTTLEEITFNKVPDINISSSTYTEDYSTNPYNITKSSDLLESYSNWYDPEKMLQVNYNYYSEFYPLIEGSNPSKGYNQVSNINTNPTVENPTKEFIVADTIIIKLKSTLFELMGNRTYIPKKSDGTQYPFSKIDRDVKNQTYGSGSYTSDGSSTSGIDWTDYTNRARMYYSSFYAPINKWDSNKTIAHDLGLLGSIHGGNMERNTQSDNGNLVDHGENEYSDLYNHYFTLCPFHFWMSLILIHLILIEII